VQATSERERAAAISAVLYPNDSTPEGKELRLKQQYFFVSASLQDVMARFKSKHGDNWKMFPDKACFQLNDTHPTIAVAELMRLLVDVEGLDWEAAWSITTKVGDPPARRVRAFSEHQRANISSSCMLVGLHGVGKCIGQLSMLLTG
jgi:glucan phosphorylase